MNRTSIIQVFAFVRQVMPVILGLLLITVGTATALTGIAITTPPDGSTVAPGQVATVTVAPVGESSLLSVLLVTPLVVEVQDAEPFTFSLAIPPEMAGPLSVLTLGKDPAGNMFSAQITLNVQPTVTLESLSVDPSEFHFFELGFRRTITVKGSYADGIERDISRAGTSYSSSDSAVVSVDSDGIMEARGNGEVEIVASHSGIDARIKTTVDAPTVNGAPVASAGPDLVVDEGEMVTLDAMGSSDPDGDPLAFVWIQLGGPPVSLSSPSTPTPSFQAPVVSSMTPLTFQLTVSDSLTSSTDTVTVSVRGGNNSSLNVNIAIKPGSDLAPVNPVSNGVVAVAILATSGFDVATVDPGTVRFGKTGTEATSTAPTLEDVNADGKLDQVYHFRTSATGVVCGDTVAKLTGQTKSGQGIVGSGPIKTTGCK